MWSMATSNPTTKMSSSNGEIFANCSSLASRSSFTDYIQEINATTGFNISLLSACKNDVCNALWGDGNADISGIGVSAHIIAAGNQR
jgi:hypothetical protein